MLGATDGAVVGATDGAVGATDGAVVGAPDEAGTLGAVDGAVVGATDGATLGTGVGEELQAATAPNMASDRVMVAIARFIWNLQGESGQLRWPSDEPLHSASRR